MVRQKQKNTTRTHVETLNHPSPPPPPNSHFTQSHLAAANNASIHVSRAAAGSSFNPAPPSDTEVTASNPVSKPNTAGRRASARAEVASGAPIRAYKQGGGPAKNEPKTGGQEEERDRKRPRKMAAGSIYGHCQCICGPEEGCQKKKTVNHSTLTKGSASLFVAPFDGIWPHRGSTRRTKKNTTHALMPQTEAPIMAVR